MKNKQEITKEQLIRLYVDQDLTTYEIADLYSCGRKKISCLLKQYQIQIKRYKRKFSDNPVETCSIKSGVSVLKCSDTNTSNSFDNIQKMMV